MNRQKQRHSNYLATKLLKLYMEPSPIFFLTSHLSIFKQNLSTPSVFSSLEMALKLQIEKQFTQLSERVKSVDIHSTEPWILASLHSGTVCILNYQSQTIEKSLKVTESPVRSAKFIARKNWIVTGADDKFVRVYNYDTLELIKEFEAHTDYVRCVAVHPELPYLLSASDDNLVKIWDWEKGWDCTQVFEGHSHYVMQVVFNPKETNIFATASLDGTIKVWDLASPATLFTLEGHSKGVNCVEYFVTGDKTYLLSGSDDYTVKVWDNEDKACIQTLEGHTNNVTAVCVHPEFPFIISGSEDGTVRTWETNTYRPDYTLTSGLERVWAIGCKKGSNQVIFGCDNGTVIVKINTIRSN